MKIRHLEMLQAVINRMASNSFMLKGWAVTLVAGTFALSAKEANVMYFMIAYIPVVLFWFLDSYYLQLERKYRKLYNNISIEKSKETDFKMTILSSKISDKTCYYQSLFSRTEIWFYLPMALLIAIVILLSIYY